MHMKIPDLIYSKLKDRRLEWKNLTLPLNMGDCSKGGNNNPATPIL